MLLIDVPVGIVAGQVIADAGRAALVTGGRKEASRVRSLALLFAYLITTPVIIYFYIGWPAWETNYFWGWVDGIQGNPSLAISSFLVIAMSLLPTLAGFETGRILVMRRKITLLRVIYGFFFLLIFVIVYLSREKTFNIAPTYAAYSRHEFTSFWSNPFFTFWLVLTVFFWGTLCGCYLYVRSIFKESFQAGEA